MCVYYFQYYSALYYPFYRIFFLIKKIWPLSNNLYTVPLKDLDLSPFSFSNTPPTPQFGLKSVF